MKFGKKLRRAEISFREIGLQVSFLKYKDLKRVLKNILANYQKWKENASQTVTGSEAADAEVVYLDCVERFMGMISHDILEIACVYNSHVSSCTTEQKFYLQAYAYLNTEAVRKICKKFDKHVSGEGILPSMMKKLQVQNFFADIRSLGPYEVGALRKLLEGEGFNDETFGWLQTGAWPEVKDEHEFKRASVVNEQWKTKRATGGWVINTAPDFSLDATSMSSEEEEETRGAETDCVPTTVRVTTPKFSPMPDPLAKLMPTSQLEALRGGSPHFTLENLGPTLTHGVQRDLQAPIGYHGSTPLHPTPGYGAPAVFAPRTPVPPQSYWESPFMRNASISEMSLPRKPQRPMIKIEQIGNLIVNYLPNQWSEYELLELFSPFGEITSARVIREKHTRKSKGFGFVKFTSDRNAEAAIAECNGKITEGKCLKVAFAMPRKSRAKANLFVSRFPSDWTSEALRKLFAPFGTIVECRVLRMVSGESKRCGFVRFATEAQADQAIIALNSYVLIREQCRIRVKVADRERYQEMKQKRNDPGVWDRLKRGR